VRSRRFERRPSRRVVVRARGYCTVTFASGAAIV
jgi:hypothetical protein